MTRSQGLPARLSVKLPQLPREPIRPEREQPDADKEIWQPHWRCFCCHDTGTVSLVLVRLIIPDYDNHKDKAVVCQHPRCDLGKRFRGDHNYDQRFTAGICDSLDICSREDWRKTVEARFQRLRDINTDIKTAAHYRRMPGSRGRTANDDREVVQRRDETELISHEEWLATASEYLGGGA